MPVKKLQKNKLKKNHQGQKLNYGPKRYCIQKRVQKVWKGVNKKWNVHIIIFWCVHVRTFILKKEDKGLSIKFAPIRKRRKKETKSPKKTKTFCESSHVKICFFHGIIIISSSSYSHILYIVMLHFCFASSVYL